MMDVAEIEKLIGEQYRSKEKLLDANKHALHLGRDLAHPVRDLDGVGAVDLEDVDGDGGHVVHEGGAAPLGRLLLALGRS